MIEIITAGTGKFRDMIAKTSDATRRVGYDVRAFDLGGVGFGEYWSVPVRHEGRGRTSVGGESTQHEKNVFGVAPWKPSIISHVLSQEVDQTKTIVWLDADAWVIRPLTELGVGYFDVAVTMRRPNERGLSSRPELWGYLNAGFVAFRPTPQAMKFLKMWQLEVERVATGSDQHAMNNIVRKVTDLRHYNRIFKLEDIKIKILATEQFNNYYAPEPPMPNTCVMHFKHNVRAVNSIEEWIEKTKPENLLC